MVRCGLRILSCLALSTLVCGHALAVGKITVDPNAAPVAPQLVANTDARLARKVTYEARYMSVQRIIEDLSTATGIKLYSGSGKSDWPVRSRRMNVFVKDVRVSDLMNSIAHVMKFRWSRNDDLNPPTYRLVVDKKAAAAADAMKKHADELKDAAQRTMREEWVEAIGKYGTMSKPEIELLRESSPVVYRNARYGAIEALRALFAELPEARERYLAGRGFRVSISKLSPRTGDLLYFAGSEFWRYLQDIKLIGGEPIGYGDLMKRTDEFDVTYYRLDQADSFTPCLRWWGAERSTGVVAFMGGSWDRTIADLNAISDDWSKYKCARQDTMWDGRKSPDEVPWDSRRHDKLIKDLEKEEEVLYPNEPLNEHPGFPELEKPTKLKIEAPRAEQNPELAANSYIASFQKALADATGMGIVSDSWVKSEGEKTPDQEAKLSELLDKFSTQFNYNWDKNSSILEFRHRKWWKNRLNQISDNLVTTWSENTRKNGVLSLDDLAQISTLNYYQTEESVKADKVLGTAGVYQQVLDILDKNGAFRWLRLYASLSPQLRALLMGQGGITSEGGINGHMLTSEQWRIAQTMFDRIGTSRGDAVFHLVLVPNDKNITYRFTEIDNDTGEEDRRWEVTLPRYTPPANEEKAGH